MPRIVYVVMASGGVAGGQKMALRHVETLNALGFDAVCQLGPGSVAPRWFEHAAPIEDGIRVQPDDILVVPEDSADTLTEAVASDARVIVLSQNLYYCAATVGIEVIARHPERLSTFITVGRDQTALMRRLFPYATIEMIRCFADERIFRPQAKELMGAYAPRKRPIEAPAIRRLHRLLHPDQRIGWVRLINATEASVAETFGRASVFLSLSRLESVGMTTLEAMASGCVCVGFTGMGGAEYATADNGFWVPEDDCVAAADALAEAIALARDGGPRLQRMLEAGHDAARQWSYAAFRDELEAAWTRLAPETRR